MKLIIILPAVFFSLVANVSFGEFLPTYYIGTGVEGLIPREEYPTYKDGVLIIPRVDTPERVGMFQDAKFTFVNGVWQLVDFKIAEVSPLLRPYVASVEIIITDSFPVQVFLKAKGHLNQCSWDNAIGKISQRLIGNIFEITIHENKLPNPVCDSDILNLGFDAIVPLSVYSLRAGIYQYTFSGSQDFNPVCTSSNPCDSSNFYVPKTFTGTFELKKDNRF